MKKIAIPISIIFLIIVVYLIMMYDTNNVVQDFKDCISNHVLSQDIKDTELYRYYCRSKDYSDEICDANVNARRILVLHNFKKGIIFLKYDCEVFDETGKYIYGSANVYTVWYIEKINGKWTVYKIKEVP